MKHIGPTGTSVIPWGLWSALLALEAAPQRLLLGVALECPSAAGNDGKQLWLSARVSSLTRDANL